MKFEWAEAKRQTNQLEQGTAVVAASRLLNGHPVVQRRIVTAGESLLLTVGPIVGCFVTVGRTPREGATRLISARRSRREEQ